MRPLALAATLLACACGKRREEPAAFALRAVVAPALARLEAGQTPAVPAGEPGADVHEAFEAIVGPLAGGDPGLRELVIEDARRLPPEGVELLARALLDPAQPAEVRLPLAEVLGALATPRALEALCAGLEGATEPALRTQCAYRLGLAGDDRVVPRLVLRLKYERDFETVYWIADALARFDHLFGIGALLVTWSEASTQELREHAAARLGELARERGLPDAEALRARWDEGTLEPRAQPSAALVLEGWRWIARLGEWNLRPVDDARFVLVGLEGWIVPLLAEALHDEEVHVRLHAAQCLERRGPRAAAAAAELEAALAEPRIAAVAASALAALGAVAAAPALERAAGKGVEPELRIAATRALGVLGLPRSLPVLEQGFAADETHDLRQAAAEALLALDPAHAALAFVRACLTDERADAGSAELALEAWLAARAGTDPAAAAARERWTGLGPAEGHIPSADEVRERRRARAEILRELAP